MTRNNDHTQETECGTWPTKQLPDGWSWASFGDLLKNVTTSDRKLAQRDYEEEGPLAVVDQGQQHISGFTHKTKLEHPSDLPVIIFGDHTRCVKFIDFAFAQGADGVKVLQPTIAIDPRFAYHALHTLRLPDKGYSRHYKFLSATNFPLPPLNEQRRITAKLEALQARSRRAREALDAVPPLLEKLRQSILAAAFRGDLTKEWRAKHPDVEPATELLKRIRIERRKKWEEAELAKLKAKGKPPTDDRWKAKYKEPEPVDASGLPELPEGWCWACIGEIAEVGTGATPKRGNDLYYSGGTIPWVTSGALNHDEVTEGTEHVTTTAIEETNLTLYPAGTLLLAMYGEGRTRGMVSELSIGATTNQAIAAISLLGVTQPIRYLTKQFLSHNYAEIRRTSMGGVQPNLNLEKVRRLAVPICPTAEAVELQNHLRSLLARSEALNAIVTREELQLRALERSMLAAAFRGELVPQDPNDEPADVMLARLRAAAPTPEPAKRRRRRSEAAE